MEWVGVYTTVSKNMSMEQVSLKSFADGNLSDRHKFIVNGRCHGKTSNHSVSFSNKKQKTFWPDRV